jgi:hypothetical protein
MRYNPYSWLTITALWSFVLLLVYAICARVTNLFASRDESDDAGYDDAEYDEFSGDWYEYEPDWSAFIVNCMTEANDQRLWLRELFPNSF